MKLVHTHEAFVTKEYGTLVNPMLGIVTIPHTELLGLTRQKVMDTIRGYLTLDEREKHRKLIERYATKIVTEMTGFKKAYNCFFVTKRGLIKIKINLVA